MIELNTPVVSVTKNSLIGIFHNQNLQQVLAAQIVASSAEGLLDMIADKIMDEKGPTAPIHPSFADVKNEMSRAKEFALDFVDDMIEDLRMQLIEEIKRCEVKVRKVELNEVDFDVNVEVKYAG